MTDAILFEDSFNCVAVNHQKYDRVARITATSVNDEVELTLDINIEVYPFNSEDKFQMSLASTLALDGKKDEGRSWREVSKGESTLADHYDYVMYGKIYKFDEGEGTTCEWRYPGMV